jgi:hypothetical protein
MGRRAADLGWDASGLFGCSRRNPRVDLGCAGLLRVVGGGGIVGLHSDWAVALCQPRRFAYMSRVSRTSDIYGDILGGACRTGRSLPNRARYLAC